MDSLFHPSKSKILDIDAYFKPNGGNALSQIDSAINPAMLKDESKTLAPLNGLDDFARKLGAQNFNYKLPEEEVEKPKNEKNGLGERRSARLQYKTNS